MVRKVMPDQVLQLRLVEAKIVLGQGQTQISTNLAKIKEIHLWHSQVEEQRVNSEIQQRAIMAHELYRKEFSLPLLKCLDQDKYLLVIF